MAFMPAAPSGKILFLVCLVSYTGVQTQHCALLQPALANSSIHNTSASKFALTGFDHSHKKLHCLAVHYRPKLPEVSIRIAEGPWTIG